MENETLDQLIERMEKECETENKKKRTSASGSCSFGIIEHYQRKYDDSRNDDER